MMNQNCGPYQRMNSCQQPRQPMQMRNQGCVQQEKETSCMTQPSKTPGGCSCEGLSREQLLRRITLSGFACVEAALYLDTHPRDTEAILYFEKNDLMYREAMEEYAKAYGPLTLAHAHHSGTYWEWVNQPWPWQ